MTEDEMKALMCTDKPLPIERARRVFSGECARLEQAGQQRFTPTPMAYRKMEFEAVKRIASELGVNIE